jgi:type III secretory pathway component EscT
MYLKACEMCLLDNYKAMDAPLFDCMLLALSFICMLERTCDTISVIFLIQNLRCKLVEFLLTRATGRIW